MNKNVIKNLTYYEMLKYGMAKEYYIEDQIERLKPINMQEAEDKKLFLEWLREYQNILIPNNRFGHFTSSAFVVNQDRTKALMVYNNIFKGWVYPGKHADGEDYLLSVATKEVFAQTGIHTKVLDGNFFAIQSLPIMTHMENNEVIPAHTHLDVVYLLEANDKEKLSFRVEENKAAKWVDINGLDSEKLVYYARPTIKKLVKKLEINNI